MARGKFILRVCLLWLFMMPVSASVQASEEGVTDSAIRIGVFSTLSGPDSSRGRNFLEGLQTFFNHVNNIGGVFGRNIVVLAEDDGQDPEDQGVAAARRMVGEEGAFVIASTSGVATTRTLIEREVLTEDIPALAGAALSKSLFSTFRRNIFFLGMPHGDQVTLAIEYILKSKPGVNPRMGLLYQDGSFGEEVREGFHRVTKRYALQVVYEESYGQDTVDFGPFVNRLWSAQADHVVLGATAWEAVHIFRETSRLNWFPQFIGPSSTAEPDILVEAGEWADNLLVVDYLGKPWEREPGVTLMIGNTQKYFPRKDAFALHRYHILGYVSALLVAEALEGTGGELTREAFIEAFERLQNFNTHGLAGVIGYKADSRLSDSRGRVFRFAAVSGRFLPLTDWSQPMMKTGQ